MHGVLFCPHQDGSITIIPGTSHYLTRQQSHVLEGLYEKKGGVATKEHLAGKAWGEPERWPDEWENVLAQDISRIRAALPKGYITTEHAKYWKSRPRYAVKLVLRQQHHALGWRLVGDLHIRLFSDPTPKE